MKIFLQSILVIVLFIGIIFSIEFLGLVNLKIFGVAKENINREIFEKTKSYKHGAIRDLQNLVLEYHKAISPEHKSILADTIRHRTANIKEADLPYNLVIEIKKIRGSL